MWFFECCVSHQNDTFVCCWIVSGYSDNITMHLVNENLTVTFFSQFSVQQIQCTPCCNYSSFIFNTITPFLILTFFIDDMDLYQNRNRTFINQLKIFLHFFFTNVLHIRDVARFRHILDCYRLHSMP